MKECWGCKYASFKTNIDGRELINCKNEEVEREFISIIGRGNPIGMVENNRAETCDKYIEYVESDEEDIEYNEVMEIDL